MNKGENMTIKKHELKYEKELQEIATLLHEDIAQKMYAIFNHLQYLQQHIQDRRDRTRNEEMIKLTKETVEDLRFLSQSLSSLNKR